jgi:lipoprotein-anchoring transpeptidase ErfK/SrfK
MRCVRSVFLALLSALASSPFAAPDAGAREVVAMQDGTPGTIIVRTKERRLYFVLGNGRAIRYPVGVGRVGMQWTGRASVEGIYIQPAWSPPHAVRRDNPNLPDYIPGGAPNNPMGAAALTLRGGEYAIHGTNRPNSVGRFVSYGCIRMYNRDVLDLMDRVQVGTPVLVTQ